MFILRKNCDKIIILENIVIVCKYKLEKEQINMPINLKETLWNEYIHQISMDDIQKIKLKTIGENFYNDVSFLYDIYPLIGEDKVSCSDKKTNVTFENEGTLYILRKEKSGIFLGAEEMKKLISDMITLFEDILPLGSVVDLKKDKLFEGMGVTEVENFRVIITKRFLGAKAGCFYPYGAVIYPIGMAEGKVIAFTPALIARVIHTGYSDETDETFVFQMKRQLVIKERRKSAGFATKQELAETAEMIRKLEA